jgi:hypothetical protein
MMADDGPEKDDQPKAAHDAEPNLRAVDGDGKADALDETPEQEEFEFDIPEGTRTVSHRELIARNTPIIVEWKFEGRSVRGRKRGLIPFANPDVVLVVPARAGKVEIDPTYDDDGNVTKVTLRPHVKARTVMDARTEEARQTVQYLHADKVEA